MAYPRHLAPLLGERARRYPVSPSPARVRRARRHWPRSVHDLPYLNLERPDTAGDLAVGIRAACSLRGPGRRVSTRCSACPSLLSWVQAGGGCRPPPGRFVLTGSHSFELMDTVTQCLAGRTALLQLLPMSIAELREGGHRGRTDRLIFAGGYPARPCRRLQPAVTLADYFATYVERDLRQLVEVRNLEIFRRFVRLAAGRVGQVLNLHSLVADTGVTDPTARARLDLLEASYVVRSLTPWFANLGKRLDQIAKAVLLRHRPRRLAGGHHRRSQLAAHPLRGTCSRTWW